MAYSAPSASSPVIALRSTLSTSAATPSTVRHIDLVKKNDAFCDPHLFTPVERLWYRNCEFYTVITEQQRLIFKFPNLIVNGWAVNAKLSMVISPDSYDPITFIRRFYPVPSSKPLVTSDTLVAALKPFVQKEVLTSLARVNLACVPANSPIKSIDRYKNIAAIAKGFGLHLFVDQLVLEAV